MDEENKTKKKKKTGLIVSIVIILLAIIAGSVGGVLYSTLLKKTTVDLSKYISIEFEGYEGYASFNEEDLVFDQKELKKVLDSKKLAEKLEQKLLAKVEISNNEKLSNGDEIEIKFKISEDWLEENKIELASDTIKIKVKDLEETDSIDLFEDLEFTYSGISPDLSIELKNNSKDDFIKNYVTYSMERDKETTGYSYLYGIANGDKITVKASYDQTALESAGYRVKEDKYTFTVEKQAAYISDAKEITDDIQKKIEPKLLEKAKSVANNSDFDVASIYHEDFSDSSHYDYKFTHTDPQLEKMYIAIHKNPDNISWSDSRNIIYAIYKTVFTDTTTSKTYNFYITVKVEDLVATDKKLYEDKTYYYEEFIVYGVDKVYKKSVDETYKIIEKETKETYTLTEVK